MADEGAGKKRRIKEDHAAKTKRQVMTRMMDKVSDDFVNNFADTRIDEGPEAAARNAQLQAFAQETEEARRAAEALAAREEREAREKAEGESQQTFRGFAALMGRKNTAEVKVGGMFARLLGDDSNSESDIPAASDQGASNFAAGGEAPSLSGQPADGVIKTRAGGKKRGLYTSCMNKPVLGGEPHRPMSMSQDPSISTNQKPAQDIAARVAASKLANTGPKPAAHAAPAATNQSGWKKIDAEPLSKLAQAARSGNNLPPAVPQNQNVDFSTPASSGASASASGSSPVGHSQAGMSPDGSSPVVGIGGSATSVSNAPQGAPNATKGSSDDGIPASTAKSVKDRSEAMAKMLPSGAREFTLPPMPSAAELSTLRRLANDGKGTKAIPASVFEQSRSSTAQPEEDSVINAAPQSHPVAKAQGPVQAIFGKVCAGLSKLFGRGK